MTSLIGKKFGRLLVKSDSGISNKYGNKKVVCLCDCGNTKLVYESSLRSNSTKSCGCYNKEVARKRMSKGWSEILTKDFLIENHVENKSSLRKIAKNIGCTVSCVMNYMKKFNIPVNDPFYDIIGKKFGKLEVLKLNKTENGSSYWDVKCDCGNLKIIKGHSLVWRQCFSCGCLNKEKRWKGKGDLSGSYWSKLIKHALERNLEFSITIEYAWELFIKQQSKCALSGVVIQLDRQYGSNSRMKKTTKQTASLDRINSTLGYMNENVQWVHVKLNKMKMDMEEEEFLTWCKTISDFHQASNR